VVPPLSEREQQILDELEKELKGRPAAAGKSTGGERYRGLKLGVVLFVAGIVLLVWFFASGFILAGVGAFAAMVAGIVLGASSIRTELSRGGNASERIARTVGGWDDAIRRRYRRH
jgi:uncharacterized membrane protein HdeD (DUF308 family)